MPVILNTQELTQRNGNKVWESIELKEDYLYEKLDQCIEFNISDGVTR